MSRDHYTDNADCIRGQTYLVCILKKTGESQKEEKKILNKYYLDKACSCKRLGMAPSEKALQINIDRST